MYEPIVPCFVLRVAFFAADAMPHLRRSVSASAGSPFASTRAFLHSIMPAPVFSRSCFTNCALISAISSLSELTRTRRRRVENCAREHVEDFVGRERFEQFAAAPLARRNIAAPGADKNSRAVGVEFIAQTTAPAAAALV